MQGKLFRMKLSTRIISQLEIEEGFVVVNGENVK